MHRSCWQGQYISQVDPTLTNLDARTKELWDDAKSRSMLIVGLILDSQSGTLRQMVEMTYPGQGEHPEMGADVTKAAEELAAAVNAAQ